MPALVSPGIVRCAGCFKAMEVADDCWKNDQWVMVARCVTGECRYCGHHIYIPYQVYSDDT